MESTTNDGLTTNQSGAQLTLRALVTGMVFGSILSLCNLYVGLKIGWGIGMSLTAALLAFGFWQILQQSGRSKGLSMLLGVLVSWGCSPRISLRPGGPSRVPPTPPGSTTACNGCCGRVSR